MRFAFCSAPFASIRHLSRMTADVYARERQVAIAAVAKACKVAVKVQRELIQHDEVGKATKSDNSPVTVADYAAQALICKLITSHFPDYPIVGEEDAKDLRSSNAASLRSTITSLANWALKEPCTDSEEQKLWSSADIDQAKGADEDIWLSAIDKGNADKTASGKVWALDPIDGTKGFLRKGQYAVCLALMDQGVPVMGVIGCPNLPLDFRAETSRESGVIFVATKGQGAFQRSLSDVGLNKIEFNTLADGKTSHASFCESVEAGHSDQSTNAKIASLLGITKAPTRMDSQAKYCSVSRGDGDIYLRLPVRADYQEKIWDHASGAILVSEAGGKVTDCHGKELNFAVGRTLKENKGIIACHRSVHATVLDAVQGALNAKSEQ